MFLVEWQVGQMLFVIVLPVIGVLAYLVVRGSKIGEHQIGEAPRADAAMRAYICETVDSSRGDGLTALVDHRDRGIITEAELEVMRRKVDPSGSDGGRRRRSLVMVVSVSACSVSSAFAGAVAEAR